jgi:hypothetical protein
MTTITALPTRYAGCHFRSRTEARWAVFFDTLGVPWQYEPQGFDLNGHRYLPDFWLPSLNAWYEVKGRPPTEHEEELALQLANGTGCNVYIVWGDIPRNPDTNGYDQIISPSRFGDEPRGITPVPNWDIYYAWCVCPHCGKVGIQFEARGERVCPHPEHPEQRHPKFGRSDRGHTGNDRRLLAAYEAARSARFEHGQSG